MASLPALAPPADFGTLDGKAVRLFKLGNASGSWLEVSNYGTIITQLHVPDRHGELADVVLGCDDLATYRERSPYFGSTAGRVANRIRDARFELDGKVYEVAANNGPHNLHGGVRGFDKVVWDAEQRQTELGPEITFTYLSQDGEEGFPGTVRAEVTYAFTHDHRLIVRMSATTDRATLLNLVHHTYWNLGGVGSGTIVDHELTIHADEYTPGVAIPGADPVPDGQVAQVAGTPFDFRQPKPIGKDLLAVGGTPIGYDDNWVVTGEPSKMRPVARVEDPKSGRVLTLEADQPGVQFYSGKFLDGTLTGKGVAFPQYGGFCLETQKFPNAINVPAWREQVILRPGSRYEHTMVHRFSVE